MVILDAQKGKGPVTKTWQRNPRSKASRREGGWDDSGSVGGQTCSRIQGDSVGWCPKAWTQMISWARFFDFVILSLFFMFSDASLALWIVRNECSLICLAMVTCIKKVQVIKVPHPLTSCILDHDSDSRWEVRERIPWNSMDNWPKQIPEIRARSNKRQ